jgi:hypothetical protein
MRAKIAFFATILAVAVANPALAADLSCSPYHPGQVCRGVPPEAAIVVPSTFGPPMYVVDQGPTFSGPGLTVYGTAWTTDQPLRRYPFVVSHGGYIGGYR